MFKVLFLLTLVSFVSCTERANSEKPTAEEGLVELRENIIGWWYGKIPMKGSPNKREWLKENRKDGTYSVTIRETHPDGAYRESQETGIWGVSPGYFFIAVRGLSVAGKPIEVDFANPKFYDLYKIKLISHESMIYQSMETGTEFETEKVIETFNL